MVDEPRTARPLRFVIFGESILSEWENPLATSARAVLSALAALNHEVTFMERRGNRPLLHLLRARGSAPLRSFAARYPDLSYRTYDLPSGWERTVWFGREVATADAVVALPGTPDPILIEIDALESRNLVRFVDATFGGTRSELRLVRAGDDDGGGVVFGPAVRRFACPDGPARNGIAIVAYDAADDALRLAEELADLQPRLIVTGSAALPGWEYVPEVDLPATYCRLGAAVVVGIGDAGDPFAAARPNLPLGSGCLALDGADATDVRAALAKILPGEGLPPDLDAGSQAATLAEAALAALLAKRPA